MQGDTLQIIGNVRVWNDEIYIMPEIIKSVDSRWLMARKLEIQNSRKDMPISESAKDNSLKDDVMKKIKDAEVDGGVVRGLETYQQRRQFYSPCGPKYSEM